MTFLSCYIAFALVGLLAATPTSKDDKLIITQSIYIKDLVKYKGDHDIVNILVPLNSLNFDETSSSDFDQMITDITLFFVEADIQPDGSRVDQGLYVLKGGKAKKILDYGRDAAASADDSKSVFFGARDGLYEYNRKKNSAVKYGPITDSITGIAKEQEGDVIYILTEDRDVYKITNNGETKEKIEDIVNAQQFVLDYSNNLYFYSEDKVPYVLKNNRVKKIKGLPKIYSSVNLIKPPYILDDGVPVLVDDNLYIIYANGTSELADIEVKPKAKPTAYAPEAALVQYYAYNKKIYEYNVMGLLLLSILEDLGSYLTDKESQIRTLASKPIGRAPQSKA